MRGVAVITLLAACSFQLPRPNDNAGDGGDAPGDSGVCGWPYVPEYYDPCTLPAPGPALDLSMVGLYEYNTTTGVLTDPLFQMTIPPSTDGTVRQLLVEAFSIGADTKLRVFGNKPLLVIAAQTITITGEINASSFFDGLEFALGAGANPAVCPLTPPEKGQTCGPDGGSGGGAGAYGAAAGSGGEGGDTHTCDGVDGKPGGAGGSAAASFATLRGGCAGRDGAPSEQVGSPGKIGRGAPGGGAVYLSARTLVTVAGTGVIHAGGAGGRASQGGRAGGGGGGSGGMIGLEAQTVIVMTAGILAANGGAGGGGADGNIASPGDDAKPSAAAAPGGKREGAGGDGGDGGFLTTPFGQSAPGADRGGGGGGGSVGVVHLHSSSLDITGATISPAPQ